MNNLYTRIGIDAPTSEMDLVRRRVHETEQTKPWEARVAEFVLLDPRRKDVYDRTFYVVSRIGQVRANLGLSRTPAWLLTGSSDFDAPPSVKQSSHGRKPRALEAWQLVGILVGLTILPFALTEWWSSRHAARSPLPGDRSLWESKQPGGTGALVESGTKVDEATPAPSHEDAALAPVKELVRGRSRSMGLVLTDAEVDAYALRLLNGPAEPTPTTGVLYRASQTASFAPFEVKTRPGANYYIKVVGGGDEVIVLTAFIRGGEPFETTLPVGTYRVRYAAGETWYGPMLDFGLGASYSLCEDNFEFRKSFRGYTGYTLELILQANGNMRTSPLGPGDF